MSHTAHFALPISACALVALVILYQPEPVPVADFPHPTPDRILARLEELGAKWKLNRHGQVNWLFLKRLPLSDEDLRIVRALPELRTLNMRGIHTIKGNSLTDAGLQWLSGLKKLEKLDLSANYRLTDASSRWIGELTNLRWLNISQTKMTHAALPNLSRLRRLQEFYTNGFLLSAETVAYLERMSLRRATVRIPDESMSLLPRLPELQQFPRAWHEDVRDLDLQHITHIAGIMQLRVILTNGWSDTSQLRYLRALPNLQRLWLSTSQEPTKSIDRGGILSLAEVPRLERVYPVRCNDEVLTALTQCPQIQLIELNSPAQTLTPEGVLSLKSMPNLKAVSLPRKLVTPEFLAAVSQIESLEVLGLDSRSLYAPGGIYPAQDDVPRTFPLESLAQLSRLPHLKTVFADGWGLGDAAMKSFAQLASLETLSISNSILPQHGPTISDAALLQLRHLRHLKYLNFYGTQTSMTAAETLSEFLPDCYIEDNWCCGCLSIGPRPTRSWESVFNAD